MMSFRRAEREEYAIAIDAKLRTFIRLDFGGMFDAHHRLWRAHADLGERGTSELELEQAFRLIPKIEAGEDGVDEVIEAYGQQNRRRRKTGS